MGRTEKNTAVSISKEVLNQVGEIVKNFPGCSKTKMTNICIAVAIQLFKEDKEKFCKRVLKISE